MLFVRIYIRIENFPEFFRGVREPIENVIKIDYLFEFECRSKFISNCFVCALVIFIL